MTKERKSNREGKKKPAMTMASKDSLIFEKTY